MKIRALFFAQLREIFGVDEREFEVKEGTSIERFVGMLVGEGYGQLAKISLSYAVNEEWAKPTQTLRAGDRLALLPPVAGG